MIRMIISLVSSEISAFAFEILVRRQFEVSVTMK